MCDRTPGWTGTGEEESADHLARVHVAYGSDVNNFPGLYISMLSLSRKLQEPGNCTIHVIVPERDLPKAAALMACFREEIDDLPVPPQVLLHKMRPLALNTSGFATDTGTTNELAYAKLSLQLHETLLKAPRVIWLDTDTIVLADVARLYRVRMRHPVAVSLDYPHRLLSFYEAQMPKSLQSSVADWSARAFTTGVMVYDLERWRAEDFSGELLGMARELRGYDGDQLPMNLLFQGRFDQLDCRWNTIVMSDHPQTWLPCIFQEIWVLHQTGPAKYWNSDWVDDMSRRQMMPFLHRHGVMPKKAGECRVFADSWRTVGRGAL